MTDKLLARILNQAQIPDLLDALVERLTPTDLQSLLLEVYRRRTAGVTPAHLLRQYEQNRFVRPAQIDPRQQLAFDRLAYSLLPAGFQTIELSPVCPLGTNSAVATVDQNKIVTTIRNTEVCADSTNVLALECALRRRELGRSQERRNDPVKLCASQRVIRAQVFDGPASFAHFRLLSLCTAGRDRGSYRFEADALKEQIGFYLDLIQVCQQKGFAIGQVRGIVTAFDEIRVEALSSEVITPLAAQYEGVAITLDADDTNKQGYYCSARFQIRISDMDGNDYLIVDGGFTDWTQQLLSNHKERLLISGMGSERFLFCFGRPR
ncbi:MAG: hypothetical protein JW934_05245 [Anaerolineae bacterium]|nr:hypothetical protein [Anaerolineae bacterium]